MTKKDLVQEISKRFSDDELKITQLKAKEIVQYVFDAIIETLLSEKRIELRNFGVFEVKPRRSRKARNPRTGDTVEVPAKNVVTFKPGKDMEEKVLALTDVPPLEESRSSTDSEVNKANKSSTNSTRKRKPRVTKS